MKKVKHRLVENMSSGTADALGLSRAILCNGESCPPAQLPRGRGLRPRLPERGAPWLPTLLMWVLLPVGLTVTIHLPMGLSASPRAPAAVSPGGHGPHTPVGILRPGHR